MKKKLLIILPVALLALVVLATVGAYYWHGKKSEEIIRLALAESSNSPVANFTIKDYNRGLFQSSFDIETKVTSLATGQILIFSTIGEILHGPYPFLKTRTGKGASGPLYFFMESRSSIPAATLQMLPAALRIPFSKLAVSTISTMKSDGNWNTDLLIPGLTEKTTADNEEINLKLLDISGHMTLQPDAKDMTGNLLAPLLEITGPGAQLKIAQTQASFKAKFSADKELINSNFIQKVGKFTLQKTPKETGGPQESFALEGLTIGINSNAGGGKISGGYSIKIDRITAPEEYGPIDMEFSMVNFDANAVNKLEKILQEARTGEKGADEQHQTALVGKLMGILPELLSKSPELELKKLNLATRYGDVVATAKISVDGSQTAAIANPIMLLGFMTARADLEISESLLSRIATEITRSQLKKASAESSQALDPATLDFMAARQSRLQLQNLVTRNILAKDGDKLKINASFQSGQVLVNGNPISLFPTGIN